MKCITIWNNIVINADIIEIKFLIENDIHIKTFKCGYKYPTQYWKAKQIKIYSGNNLFEFNNIIFSINYQSDYCYLE